MKKEMPPDENGKASILLRFFKMALRDLPPPPNPLVKCECIYFCTNMRIWIDLGKNMANDLNCC